MKKLWKGLVLAGVSAGMLMALTPDMAAARGGAGNGRNCQAAWRQNCVNAQTQTCQRLRLRDGSCLRASQNAQGSAQKKGNTYGPGDGSGNAGSGPQDGTGLGAPSKK